MSEARDTGTRPLIDFSPGESMQFDLAFVSSFGGEAIEFPPWSEMSRVQIEAALLAIRDACHEAGPDVRIRTAEGCFAQDWHRSLFDAVARLIEAEPGGE